jgi:RNA polymerase sigma-70 factor, ECF subfamily
MNSGRFYSASISRRLLVMVSSTDCLAPFESDGELQTTALEIEDGKIAAIYVARNPDKLRRLH